ncbi:MAG: ECF-type sigma factor [Planctomycetota bacterium]
MSDDLRATVTRLLTKAADGDQEAVSRIVPQVYEELRRLARARLRGQGDGATLQATALVHEAWIKLVDQTEVDFRGRNHFFAAAALAMRHVLVDHARARKRLKRGGGAQRVELTSDPASPEHEAVDILALDAALKRLAEQSPRRAQVVELRWFGGLTNREVAETLGIGEATVERDWQFSKAWLKRALAVEPS